MNSTPTPLEEAPDDNLTQFPLGNEHPVPADQVLQQEVSDIQAAVLGAVEESSLDQKVEALRAAVDELSEASADWRTWYKGPDPESFHALKHQVEEVQAEWQSLTGSLQNQRERLDTLLSAFPTAVEVSAVRALAIRLSHVEQLVSQLVGEHQVKSTNRLSRTQLVVSVAALGITVVLWTGFFAMSAFAG